MKLIVTVYFILFFLYTIVLSEEVKNKEINNLLKNIDISDSYYKNQIYGSPKIDIFKSANNLSLLAYQARYGGDGDHSGNILHLFEFKNGKSRKIFRKKINSVRFITSNGVLQSISGKRIETLCFVCDGWEESEVKDIFIIPININIKTLQTTTELTQEQKKQLREKFIKQSKKNIREQLSYGQEDYPKKVEILQKRFFKLLK